MQRITEAGFLYLPQLAAWRDDHRHADRLCVVADLRYRARQKSGRKSIIKPFAGGVSGPDLQTVPAMQAGSIDPRVTNAGRFAGNAKESAVLDFPYLPGRMAEADAVVDSPVGQKPFDKDTKYPTLTSHVHDIQVVSMREKVWDSMSEDGHKVMREAAAEAATDQCQAATRQTRRRCPDQGRRHRCQ